VQTAVGVVAAFVGVVIVAAPWTLAVAPGGAMTVVLETIGAVIALLGLALSHRVFPRTRARDPRR